MRIACLRRLCLGDGIRVWHALLVLESRKEGWKLRGRLLNRNYLVMMILETSSYSAAYLDFISIYSLLTYILWLLELSCFIQILTVFARLILKLNRVTLGANILTVGECPGVAPGRIGPF
jgi:hypothetical protein